MEEHELRSRALVRENERLHDRDVRRIFGGRRGFVAVSCPACGRSGNKTAFAKKGFRFASCSRCGTLYVNPRPPRRLLDRFYSAPWMEHWNRKIFPYSEEPRRRRIFRPRAERVVDLCRKHGVKTGVLLDIGAGFGTFCEEVKKLNFFKRVVAVEPSAGLAVTCRNKGIETIERMVEDLRIDPVPVITNFELLEHLFSPREFLASCHRVLSRRGLLFLTTPNIRGFDLALLGPASDNIAAPEHLNYFNPDSLSLLLEKTGFRVEEVLTPGKMDADIVRNKVREGTYRLEGNSFLREILFEKWETLGAKFQDFLAENRLSSHLWVVARRW